LDAVEPSLRSVLRKALRDLAAAVGGVAG